MTIGADILARGGKRLAPGYYALDDVMYVDADELCAHHGVLPTDRNLQTILQAIEREYDGPIELEDAAGKVVHVRYAK